MATIGELDERVTVEAPTEVRDSMGGYTNTWAKVAERWARVTHEAGAERLEAGRMVAVQRFNVRLRHMPELTTEHRLVHRGRSLNIESVTMVGRNEWTDVMATETV